MDELRNIIESLLFVTDEPLTVDRIRKVVKTADARAIREAVQALSEEYEARKGGFTLSEVAGGYQLRTRPEYKEYIKDLLQPAVPRLSKAALETLAIIAYKQPIIRADLEHIRGVDSGGVLRMLLKRKLIRVLGRKEIPGRPLIYATTKRFLEMFDLKDLKDLPTPKEIEDLGSEASDELAAAFEALDLPPEGPPSSIQEDPAGEQKAAPDPAVEMPAEEKQCGGDAPDEEDRQVENDNQDTDIKEYFDSEPDLPKPPDQEDPAGSEDESDEEDRF
jgi:segregation and condensation protein B